MIEWIASLLIVAGSFFCLVAGIGVVRLKDTYQRMHASTKAGTLGLALVCIGVMLLAETWLNVVEALFVFLFMIATAPIGSHLIGRAAFRTRNTEAPNTSHDPGCDVFRASRPNFAAAPSSRTMTGSRPS